MSPPTTAQLDEAVRAAATVLEEAAGELAPQAAADIHAGVPELPKSLAVTTQTTAGVRELLSAFARAVQRGTPPAELIVPEETLEHARLYVRRGVDLSVLLRTYRVGHGVVWRLWIAALDDISPDPTVRLSLRDHTTDTLFRFLDVVTGRIVEEYHAERERWSRSAAARRLAMVRELLDGQPVDPATASSVLRLELRGRHVAMVLWTTSGQDEGGGPQRLRRAAEELASERGGQRPLLVPVGHRVLWAWLAAPDDAPPGPSRSSGAPRSVAPDEASSARPPERTLRSDGVSVAIGEPGSGVAGFRHSHEEAQAARRVALLGGRPPGAVVHWQRSGLLGLLAGDEELARRFAARELGALAADDDVSGRLRATLATYLREGAHVARTADRLGVHANTIGNRLRQAEVALGRPIDRRRQELQAALLLCDGLAGPDGAGEPGDEPEGVGG